MKYIILSVFLFTLLLSCRQNSPEYFQGEINNLTKRWVPDKRVGICDLTLVSTPNGKMVLRGESMYPAAKNEAIQYLNSKGVEIIDSVAILPDTVKIPNNWGLVCLSIANLRSKPSHPSELLSQAIMGTPVRVLKVDGRGWVLVQTPDRYIGWTNESAVQKLSRSAINDWKNADRIIFTENFGVIFGDSHLTKVVSDLIAGTILVKKSENREHIEVRLPDGRSGYVLNQKWLGFNQWKDTVALTGNRMIETGETFLGFPYLWGGTSSKGIDCSGFAKTVCFLNGVILERDASQQANHGLAIDITSGWDKLQKGDLLFFGSKQPYRVVHVGIYKGDSEVIHSSGYVQISSLDKNRANFSNYLSSTLVGARRIIGYAPEQGYWPIRQHNWY